MFDSLTITEHEKFMSRALSLARLAEGKTSPNPLVGAVIVNSGEIVGEGYHHKAGQPHAEVHALGAAGNLARGATLYTTLEPCTHFGRTPPCTQNIIKCGISQVVIGTLDPNPRVHGEGVVELRNAGISVIVGVCEREVKQLNEWFTKFIITRTPFVTVKYAMSIDGKISTRTGDSRWITNEESRKQVHHLRNIHDAILVGKNTVLKDNPLLTTRLEDQQVRHPLRVVLDSQGQIPISSRVFTECPNIKTLYVTTEASPKAQQDRLEATGVNVLISPMGDRKQVDLSFLLAELGKINITTLLVEGGGQVIGSFFDHHLVDKVIAFISPMVIGGEEAPSPVRGQGINKLSESSTLHNISFSRIENDFMLVGYPVWST